MGYEKKQFLSLIVLLLFLNSCSRKELEPIPVSSSIVASINIYNQTVTFIDTINKSKTSWSMPHTFRNAALISQDQLLMLNRDSEYGYVYQLSTGEKQLWKIGKGIETILSSKYHPSIYLADQHQNSIKIFTKDGRQMNQVAVPYKPIAIYEDQHHIYVGYLNNPSISIISKKTWEIGYCKAACPVA